MTKQRSQPITLTDEEKTEAYINALDSVNSELRSINTELLAALKETTNALDRIISVANSLPKPQAARLYEAMSRIKADYVALIARAERGPA